MQYIAAMERIAIFYSTVDGHTRTICARLQAAMEAAGHEVTLASLDQPDDPAFAHVQNFDRLLIGASIRYGKHRPPVFRFIEQHRALLESRPAAFFTVNLVARKPGKDTLEGSPYMRKFIERSGWQPPLAGVFAGRLDYASYGPLDRTMIRFIMWLTQGPTSASAPVVFTDWASVDAFGQHFLTLR
ncbi:menaquinone-dependent protoporphyrinogen IX dehydrogenase [Kerstersia gyiorum]|uniref:menaquinone-dependent protoporphyrinogen IX dehydrogenase n=1 Tax=Kerstersia gyiorum TaxID=206506 RepID=UPI00209D7332|nr:menaquinone-dependent protoporphyrinogen IX dehydrogenase [Kerstersia gyiorum]MCP1635181.1 menaquinone-dependent protoporphyrinogen oxidase [Kerstersia gyiorum]MCP1669892.1 menaquinone-dependent protoporphyrinogen oxidase [Kerstersia gyiorum]MCP1707797.1 menaquinone-dependent protoporphyrinogen oxidase [Kerstersia gyiorum]